MFARSGPQAGPLSELRHSRKNSPRAGVSAGVAGGDSPRTGGSARRVPLSEALASLSVALSAANGVATRV